MFAVFAPTARICRRSADPGANSRRSGEDASSASASYTLRVRWPRPWTTQLPRDAERGAPLEETPPAVATAPTPVPGPRTRADGVVGAARIRPQLPPTDPPHDGRATGR